MLGIPKILNSLGLRSEKKKPKDIPTQVTELFADFPRIDKEIEKQLVSKGLRLSRIADNLDMFGDPDDIDVVRGFARLTKILGKKVLSYEQFLVDGTSGVFIEHFLSELFWILSNQHKTKNPPREYTFPGRTRINKDKMQIEEAMFHSGIVPHKKTLLITEAVASGDTIKDSNFIWNNKFRDIDFLTFSFPNNGLKTIILPNLKDLGIKNIYFGSDDVTTFHAKKAYHGNLKSTDSPYLNYAPAVAEDFVLENERKIKDLAQKLAFLAE